MGNCWNGDINESSFSDEDEPTAPDQIKVTHMGTWTHNLAYGASGMQGRRASMEDAHLVNGKPAGADDHAVFGVFDGHGGDFTAKFAAAQLLSCLDRTEAWQRYLQVKTKFGLHAELVGEALKQALFDLDVALQAEMPEGDISGSTAIVAVITPSHVVCANVGDSRAIIRTQLQTVDMSQDHKPDNPKEKARITQAGGHVSNGRVDSKLAVSRALGDFGFKDESQTSPQKQKVSAEADILVHERTEEDLLLMLACDGIFEVYDNNDFARLMTHEIGKCHSRDLGKAVEQMLDKCYKKGSMDNMSIMGIQLNLVS